MNDPTNVEPRSSVGAPTENEAAPKRCSEAPGSAGLEVFSWPILTKTILGTIDAADFMARGRRYALTDKETGAVVVCYWLNGRVMIDAINLPNVQVRHDRDSSGTQDTET